MDDLILALRNACRNRRRSLVTVFALSLCTTGLILFGGYVKATFAGDETRTVTAMGHLQIFRRDFPEKGIGSPASFAIEDHEGLMKVLREDSQLGPLIRVATGQLTFTGLANCYQKNTSAAFVGFGVYPDDYAQFANWNPYDLTKPDFLEINELFYEKGPWLDDKDIIGGSIGTGLAEVLEIEPPSSPDGSATSASEAPDQSNPVEEPTAPLEIEEPDEDVPNFAVLESSFAPLDSPTDGRPRLELLCVPEAGASPNVQTLAVRAARPFENTELDDRLILMHIEHASQLLFPGQPVRVNSLRLLLNDGADVDAAAVRIREILGRDYPELECRTWIELSPFYLQFTAYLKVIFVFMFTIIASIVVFTIYNTLAASIVERTAEIGTLRAMGVTRGRIAGLFISEAVFMGIAGGLLGVVMAILLGSLFNQMEILFMPPSTSYYMKVEVMIFRYPIVLAVGFVIAVVAAVVSSVIPSINASRLVIVDALRHA